MISIERDFIRLTIPIDDAIAFAMGWSDLGSPEAAPAMRRIIGELAVDALEYREQWRAAAMLRDSIRQLWPCDT